MRMEARSMGGQNLKVVLVVVLVVLAVVAVGWRFLTRPKYEPVIQFTQEEMQKMQQEMKQKGEGTGLSPLPLPPKGKR